MNANNFTHQVTIVTPGTEFHVARLLIEWEIFDVDFAEGFVDGRWFPPHSSVVMQNSFRHYRDFVITISTATKIYDCTFAIKFQCT